MSKSAMGIAVTTVTTDQQAPLGFIHVEPAQSVGDDAGFGERHWVYVFNDEALTAFAIGDIIQRDPSAATQDLYGGLIAPALSAQTGWKIIGVAQHVIASGSYGFIQTKGQALVKNGTGNISADTRITSGGSRAGAAVDVVTHDTAAADKQHAIFGFSLEAEATDDTTFDAYINCLGS